MSIEPPTGPQLTPGFQFTLVRQEEEENMLTRQFTGNMFPWFRAFRRKVELRLCPHHPLPHRHTHTHITNCQSFSAACVRLEGIAGQICWSALLPKQLFSLIIHSLLIQSYECALFVYITSMTFWKRLRHIHTWDLQWQNLQVHVGLSILLQEARLQIHGNESNSLSERWLDCYNLSD